MYHASASVQNQYLILPREMVPAEISDETIVAILGHAVRFGLRTYLVIRYGYQSHPDSVI